MIGNTNAGISQRRKARKEREKKFIMTRCELA